MVKQKRESVLSIETMDNQQLSPEQGKAQRPSYYGVGVQAIGMPKWYTRNLREDMV